MAEGRKTGGRRKGSPNKATAARQAAIAASGLSPLDFMLSVVRDEEADLQTRLEAARAAAPYCHPRMAPTEPKPYPDFIPLAERIKAYTRRDDLASQHGTSIKPEAERPKAASLSPCGTTEY